jgi:site-specific DNA-methyltransferase (adenine-specific)
MNMRNEIILGECVDTMSKMDDFSVDLVVADPPYWKVVNEEWDNKWKTEDEYIKWSLEWMKEVSRILRYGGSFYLFGYFRTLALVVPHLESLGLELRQQIIIDKGMRSVSGRATKNYRIFPNTTESVLLITKDNKQFLKPFLKKLQESKNLTSKEVNEKLGTSSNGGGMWSIYTGKNVCEQFPTKNAWIKLQNALEFDLDYSKVSQTFNAQIGLTDVWTDINFYDETRIHPTQKPIKLIERLILASSNENDLVVDPFGGSLSTGISCYKNNRNFISIEMDETYFEKSIERFDEFKKKMNN